jgi:starch-binding outer membrane protein, SusD/RagB family
MQTKNNKTVHLIIVALCFILICCLLSSCKKYLDKKSDNSLITPKTLDDLQALLDDNYYMNANTPAFGEASADDYFDQTSVYNSLDARSQQVYTWALKIYNGPTNDWSDNYEVIHTANFCIDQLNAIEKTPANEDAWNNIKGSALFFRGYYYLGLTWDYAKAYDDASSSKDPGIVIRASSDFKPVSTRASVADSYKQVINDLEEAGNLLQTKVPQPMRPSKVAAYGALARTFLSMRKYDSAFKYANAALQIKNELLDFNSSSVDPSSYVPFAPFNKEIIFYSTQSGSYSSKLYFYASIDTALLASYETNDLRSVVFFFPYNNYYGFKGDYAATLYPPFSGITTDEMFLIRAECYARQGNASAAMDDLNALLIKRYMTGTFVPLQITNADEALAKILLERRKELLMRGLRWIDIKRLNKENYNITPTRVIGSQTYTLAPNSDYYALPLPDDVVKETGIPQN